MLARTWLVCFCPCFSCRVFHSLWCTFFLSCCSVWQRPCYQYAFQVCITWMCWYFLKVIDVLRKKKEIHNGFSYWMLSLKTSVLIYKRRKFMVPTIPTLQLSEKLLSGNQKRETLKPTNGNNWFIEVLIMVTQLLHKEQSFRHILMETRHSVFRWKRLRKQQNN